MIAGSTSADSSRITRIHGHRWSSRSLVGVRMRATDSELAHHVGGGLDSLSTMCRRPAGTSPIACAGATSPTCRGPAIVALEDDDDEVFGAVQRRRPAGSPTSTSPARRVAIRGGRTRRALQVDRIGQASEPVVPGELIGDGVAEVVLTADLRFDRDLRAHGADAEAGTEERLVADVAAARGRASGASPAARGRRGPVTGGSRSARSSSSACSTSALRWSSFLADVSTRGRVLLDAALRALEIVRRRHDIGDISIITSIVRLVRVSANMPRPIATGPSPSSAGTCVCPASSGRRRSA